MRKSERKSLIINVNMVWPIIIIIITSCDKVKEACKRAMNDYILQTVKMKTN